MKLFANETTYKRLVGFETLTELNDTVRQHRENLATTLSETQRDVLDILAQHSVKYLGVSFLRKGKIADMVGKSRRTVIRVCHELEELGVIEQHELFRERGDKARSTNAIVIQTAVKRENPCHDDNESVNDTDNVTAECHSVETPQKTIKLLNHIEETASAREENTPATPQPANALAKSIPAPVFNALKPFLSVDGIYKYYGVLLRAKAKVNRSIMLEDVGERYAQVFHNAIRKFKQGQVRNLAGFLFASWRDLTVEIDREIAVNNDKVSDIYFDWLND
ncbi:hypothetical protein [Alkalibacillus almallahensis]|uniref:hypothetical protein n=1 Tax=Alkalibacillus almallahensis TaxID=1379154 RepID=UPI00141EBBF7|nr:hypothetical protein [Alkalibacillus almallahensis]NIK13145.1 DNA-binding Lrp family transcriptional regulator [Alkalibacillus almallahensis]